MSANKVKYLNIFRNNIKQELSLLKLKKIIKYLMMEKQKIQNRAADLKKIID